MALLDRISKQVFMLLALGSTAELGIAHPIGLRRFLQKPR
jgi:hypothetical protein